MTDPYRSISTRATPQTVAIPGTVPNSAGGHSYPLDDMGRLRRFLILGTEGGTYYIREKDLTKQNADVIQRLIAAGRGVDVVNEITMISLDGRNPKHQPVMFALAVCAGSTDPATRKAALGSLPLVARTGTHLFYFARYIEQFRGWGRGLRRAVGDWYLDRDLDDLCRQLAKYRQREGWSHRDLLRLSKPRPERGSEQDGALAWAVGKPHENIPYYLLAVDGLTDTTPAIEVASVAETQGLTWEMLPSKVLSDPVVWNALLPRMGLGALIRNLGRLTANGTLAPMKESTTIVAQRLTNENAVKRSRVHPLAVLMAAATYKQGKGVKGSLTWQPITQIMAATEKAFRLSFGNVIPANKRTLIAIDVSSSMGWGSIAGSFVTPAEGAAAMALVTLETEPMTQVVGFKNTLTKLALTPGMTLSDALRITNTQTFGGTDCTQPMIYAANRGLEFDTFIVYTDSETWAGRIHPSQALQKYREKTGIDARLIVVGMTSNGFTIADPNDAGMLDVVGFDTATPQIIADFSAGRI